MKTIEPQHSRPTERTITAKTLSKNIESRLNEPINDLEQCQKALRLANLEIERRNRNMIALTTFAYRANRVDNLTGLLQLTLQQALEITNSSIGAVVLVDSDNGSLNIGTQQGLTPQLVDILTGQNVGYGAMALMPHLVAGAGALLEYDSTDDSAERLLLEAGQLSSLASFPLIADRLLVGALLVGLSDQKSFRSSELSFLMAISQEAAIAIETLRLRERLWNMAEILLDEQRESNISVSSPKEDEQKLQQIAGAEDKIQQENMDLQILMALSDLVNSSLDLSEVLQCAVDQTRAILNTDAAWIYMVEDGQHLKMSAHVGLSKNYLHGMRRLNYSDGLEGEVFRNNKPYFVASMVNRPHKIWVEKEGLRALAAVPIARRRKNEADMSSSWHVLGVLATGLRGDNKPYEWDLHEMDLLIAISNQVALAIEKAQSYADMQQNETTLKGSNEILREINDMLIQKNASFERFVHQTLRPNLKEASKNLKHLGEAHFSVPQKQHFLTLQQILDDLTHTSDEVLN